MKIRQGFVSNSSSSSFLVKIPLQSVNTINSIEEFYKWIDEDDYAEEIEKEVDLNNIFDNGWSVVELSAEYGSEEDVFNVLNIIFGDKWKEIYSFE